MKLVLPLSLIFNKFQHENYDLVRQITAFLFVGGTSFIIYWVICNAINYSGFSMSEFNFPGTDIDIGKNEFSVAVGYFISGIYNFILNLLITFKGSGSAWKKYLMRFALVLGINNLLASLVFTPFLTDILGIAFRFVLMINSLILTFLNFVFHKNFTYK